RAARADARAWDADGARPRAIGVRRDGRLGLSTGVTLSPAVEVVARARARVPRSGGDLVGGAERFARLVGRDERRRCDVAAGAAVAGHAETELPVIVGTPTIDFAIEPGDRAG